MQKNLIGRSGAAVLVLLVAIGTIRAADAPPASTKIAIKGMHCPTCAKKITGRLKSVAGVADAQADVKAGVITVVPGQGKSLSPKALWEAVEQAKYTPVRLDGPKGSFTSKPKA